MIIGASFLIASSSDDRKTELDKYNDAVNTWNSQISDFQSTYFNASTQLVRVGNGDDGISFPDYNLYSAGLTYSMPVYHPNDVLNDSPQSGETFNSYQTFDFGWPSSPWRGPVAASNFNTLELYKMNIFDRSGNPMIPTGGSNPPNLIPTYLQGTVSVSGSCSDVTCWVNSCQSQGGAWNYPQGLCYVFYRLKSICIRVYALNDENTAWGVSANLGGNDFGGCVWSNSVPGLLAGMQPFVYEQFNYNPQSPQLNAFNWLTVNVRFYTDPWTVAEYITQGSLNFGLTVHQKFVTGIACLVVGLCYTLCLVGTVYYCVRKRTQQNTQYYKQSDPSGSYGTTSAPVMGTPVYGTPMYAPPPQYQQY